MAQPRLQHMVVCTLDAVRDISKALSMVEDIRGHLEQEVGRLAGGSGESARNHVVKGDPLVHALYRASRQLASLRGILSVQEDVPVEAYWLEERDVVVVTEARKAQSALLRAQQVANNAYQGLVARLDDRKSAGTSETLSRVEYCDRVATVAASALSSVINALADFPGKKTCVSTEIGRTTAPAYVASSHRHDFPVSPLGSNAPVRTATRASRVGGESGVFNRGIRPSGNAGRRSCRSQATSDRRGGAQASTLAGSGGSAGRSVPTAAPRAAPTATATEVAMSLGLKPVTRASSMRRQESAIAAVEERRRLMSRASTPRPAVSAGAGAGAGAGVDGRSRFAGEAPAQDPPGVPREEFVPPTNSKLSPLERHMANLERTRGTPATATRTRSSMMGGWDTEAPPGRDVATAADWEGPEVTAAAAAAATVVAATSQASLTRASSRTPLAPDPADEASEARVLCEGPRETQPHSGLHPAAALDCEAAREALDDQVAHAILDDASLAALLFSPRSPRRSRGATRARRRSLIRLQSIGDVSDSATLQRSRSAGRFGLHAALDRSPSVGRVFRTPGEETGESNARPDVKEDEAAALRLAKQEQEAQAREDELLALRLAAREEAGAERRRASRRRLRRRSRRTSPALLDPATAAAVATGGDVSEAVRALQFQDIDANDFETLLALDEGGGAGGRCCGGVQGLTERAMDAVLRSGKATGARLEESCAICMADFEQDDEISILPCGHAFHGGCIRKWLVLRNRCPTDMQPVVPDSPNAGEGGSSWV